MNKYKNLLLRSSLVLSILQMTNIKALAEEQPPIYDPTNPNQEVQPIERTRESTTVTEVSEEPTVVEDEPEPTAAEPEPEPVKETKKQKEPRILLTENLFADQVDLVNNDRTGHGKEEDYAYYLNLVSELTGTIIYGRKN